MKIEFSLPVLVVAKRVITRILDKGLANSTWREEHPEAYEDLRGYRPDLEEAVKIVVEQELRREARKLLRKLGEKS